MRKFKILKEVELSRLGEKPQKDKSIVLLKKIPKNITTLVKIDWLWNHPQHISNVYTKNNIGIFNELIPDSIFEVISFLQIRGVMSISDDFKAYEIEVMKEDISENERKDIISCLEQNNQEHKSFVKLQATPEEKEKIIKKYQESIKNDEEILKDKKESFERIMKDLEGDIEKNIDEYFQDNLKNILGKN